MIYQSVIRSFCYLNSVVLIILSNVILYRQRKLDLVLSNIPKIAVTKCESPLISKEDCYHPALDVEVQFVTGNQNTIKPVYVYDFANADFYAFYDLVRNYDWNDLESISDPEMSLSEFYRILYSFFDKTVPVKHKAEFKLPHWFSLDLIRKIRLKNRLHGSGSHSAEFKQLGRAVKYQTRQEFQTYLGFIEENADVDPSSFWGYITSRTRGSGVPEEITFCNEKYTGSFEVANAFAQYFCGVFEPPNDGSDVMFDNCGNLELPRVTLDSVINSIKKLKAKKSVGTDNIPSYIFKGCIDIFAKPLVHIFNLSISKGVFPERLKEGVVIPLHKKGNTSEVENYRGITILNPIAKAFEYLLCDSIFNFVQNRIVQQQHGFVPDRATVSNLCVFSNYASNAIDSRKQMDVIFTDAEKAFDKVSHNLLLNKLINLGFSRNSITFFQSYLSNRPNSVRIGKELSEKYVATSGVPQGSNISPLLFTIFVNDLPECVKNAECLLFADDFKIFKVISSESDCIALQNDLDSVTHWFSKNKMFLNINKCFTMTFTRRINNLNFQYKINDEVLTRSDHCKDLGVTFQSNLRFNLHYQAILSKAFRMLGFIIRNTRHFRRIGTLIKLYNTFVRPHVEYASVIWSPTAECNKDLIERLQKIFLRYLYYKQYNIYPAFPVLVPYRNMLVTFNIQPLCDRRAIQSLLFIYYIVNNIKYKDFAIVNNIKLHVPKINLRLSNYAIFKTDVSSSSPLNNMLNICNSVLSNQNCDIFNTSVQGIRTLLNR